MIPNWAKIQTCKYQNQPTVTQPLHVTEHRKGSVMQLVLCNNQKCTLEDQTCLQQLYFTHNSAKHRKHVQSSQQRDIISCTTEKLQQMTS